MQLISDSVYKRFKINNLYGGNVLNLIYSLQLLIYIRTQRQTHIYSESITQHKRKTTESK